MEKEEKDKIVTLLGYKVGIVQKSSGKHAGNSYTITIPKPFIHKMGLDKPNSYVITSLIEEQVPIDNVKKKKVYCLVEKLER